MNMKFRQLDDGDFAIFSGKPKIGEKHRIHLENLKTDEFWRSKNINTEIDEVTGLPFTRVPKEVGERVGLEKDCSDIEQCMIPYLQ
ncbi:MAG: hypothetical protein KAR20_12790 [Candidatus Heimdallarchaeota archaeon]|nr:hypothetical protein [Candidatus Heimdallarchaeota archaeon]